MKNDSAVFEARATIDDVKFCTSAALQLAVEAQAPLHVIDGLLDTLRALEEVGKPEPSRGR